MLAGVNIPRKQPDARDATVAGVGSCDWFIRPGQLMPSATLVT
jgi:hypothetical protein